MIARTGNYNSFVISVFSRKTNIFKIIGKHSAKKCEISIAFLSIPLKTLFFFQENLGPRPVTGNLSNYFEIVKLL